MEVITYHGWGFGGDCWDKLQSEMSDEVTWKNFDRGYFGEEESPSFSDEADFKVVITHSFGLHHCKEDTLKEADLLVIFSGFLHFHPAAAQFRRRSKQVLSEMISRFEEEPRKVFTAFYRNVFHPQKSFNIPNKELNKLLLLKDLNRLNESEIPLPELKKTASVCIFHGKDDAIVPREKGRGLFEQFGKKAQYFEIRDAGHALPITHALKCSEILEPMIQPAVND